MKVAGGPHHGKTISDGLKVPGPHADFLRVALDLEELRLDRLSALSGRWVKVERVRTLRPDGSPCWLHYYHRVPWASALKVS